MSLLLLLASADAQRLGDEIFAVREWAEWRLKALGPLAWPALLVAGPEGLEARHRTHRLLAAHRRYQWDRRAWDVLTDPFPPHTGEFYADHELRVRVYWAAVALGCAEWQAWPVHPRYYDGWIGWWSSVMPHARCAAAVADCRKHIGRADPGWPLRR